MAVFPSAFCRGRAALLARNVRRALDARGLRYSSVRRDGPVVAVDAADPVFASSAISEIFGPERVSIARRAGARLGELAPAIASVGAGLLLRGEAFCVRVGGRPRGYEASDAEAAATAEIVSRASGTGARPAAEGPGTRTLRAFVSGRGAYVDIFSDEGLGGAPAGSQPGEVLCPVFDGLSALACAWAMRAGLTVRIAMMHRSGRALPGLARIASRLVPRTELGRARLEFFAVRPGPGYSRMLGCCTELCGMLAAARGIGRVAVPSSPLHAPASVIDALVARLAARGIAAQLPLGSIGGGAEAAAARLGLAGLGGGTRPAGRGGPEAAAWEAAAAAAAGGGEAVEAAAGPNMAHEILDGLGGGRR